MKQAFNNSLLTDSAMENIWHDSMDLGSTGWGIGGSLHVKSPLWAQGKVPEALKFAWGWGGRRNCQLKQQLEMWDICLYYILSKRA